MDRDREGRDLKGFMSKDSRELEGRLKVVRGRRRSRKNGKREVLEDTFWGDCKVPKEAKEFKLSSVKSCQQEGGG